MDNESIAALSDGEISLALTALYAEKLRRSVASGDPDTLIKTALNDLFDSSGSKGPAIVSQGIVAVPGYIKDTSAEKHECRLFTIRMPDQEQETWVWEDDSPTYIHAETEKIAKVRRSIALHQAVDGMVIIQHSMRWDGTRHNRTGTKAWGVETKVNKKTGEIVSETLSVLSNWTPSRLPPPPGENDSRAYGGERS